MFFISGVPGELINIKESALFFKTLYLLVGSVFDCLAVSSRRETGSRCRRFPRSRGCRRIHQSAVVALTIHMQS